LLKAVGLSAFVLAATASAGEIPRFAAGTSLVVLSATATDKHGHAVVDLRADELRIFEDGRPQPLIHFSRGREAQARILLLVDASGSMNAKLQTTSVRMAAVQLLGALDPEDEVGLAAFDHRYWGVVAFTRDRKQVLDGFDGLDPFSSTALHDALDHAARDVASRGEGRRAVVVMTDGVDTASQLSPDEVIAHSRALDVPIYAISVLSPLDDPASPSFVGGRGSAGSVVLARYAALSGGAAFTVSDLTGLRRAAGEIVDQLKHQYRLGFDPAPGPARLRRLDVRTTRKGVMVHTRSGYMPPS
jgi:Ca-activated chloride channel homolog